MFFLFSFQHPLELLLELELELLELELELELLELCCRDTELYIEALPSFTELNADAEARITTSRNNVRSKFMTRVSMLLFLECLQRCLYH